MTMSLTPHDLTALLLWRDVPRARIAPKIIVAAELCLANPAYEKVEDGPLGITSLEIQPGSLRISKWGRTGGSTMTIDIWQGNKVFSAPMDHSEVINFKRGPWLEELFYLAVGKSPQHLQSLAMLPYPAPDRSRLN